MTSFDIFVSAVLGICLISSLMKGFIREIFSLFAYVGGYLMAIKYQASLARTFLESIPSKPIAKLAAFIAIYIVTAVIISLMGKITKGILWSGTDLSIFDRILGGIVGLVKGIVILVAVMFPLQFFPEVSKNFTEDSYAAPYLAMVLEYASQNPSNLDIRKKLSNFDIDAAKQRFKQLNDLNKLKDTLDDLKDKLPYNNKPLDEYSSEDKKKLEKILNDVDK